MNKIKNIFESKKGKVFIAYIVCGDPDIKTTLALMKALAESGVDIIELGMPFTDPIADGPVIQKSVENFIDNAAWALCTTHHTMLRTSPGAAIFGRDTMFNVPFVADWTKIGEFRQAQTNQNTCLLYTSPSPRDS